jgi:anti-sigma28 factor (negative regulator of flagellin synthesis)
MAFLDFMKNRQAGQQQSSADKAQQQKPETAKETHTPHDSQAKASQQRVDQMPADQKAKVEEIKGTLQKATQHMDRGSKAPSSAPADGATSPQPMRQNAMSQDKTAPPLSPTSAQKGTPATEKEQSSPKPQEKPSQRPQTLPRRPPSWER